MLFSSPSTGPTTGLGVDVSVESENIARCVNSSSEPAIVSPPQKAHGELGLGSIVTSLSPCDQTRSGNDNADFNLFHMNKIVPSNGEVVHSLSSCSIETNKDEYSSKYVRDRSTVGTNRVVSGCSCRNLRKGEDRVVVSSKENFYGIFDGHNGNSVSEIAAQKMSSIAREEILKEQKRPSPNYREAVRKSFFALNDLVAKNSKKGGSTAQIFVLIDSSEHDASKPHGFCANAGDSRAVLCHNGRAVCVSEEHSASNPFEVERIKRVGGTVELNLIADEDGDGVLEVSRGFGNFRIPGFCCEPFVSDPIPIGIQGFEFLIMASDGLWDVVKDQEAVNYVRTKLENGNSLAKISEDLVQIAITKGTCDDTSCIIISLLGQGAGEHAISDASASCLQTPPRHTRRW